MTQSAATPAAADGCVPGVWTSRPPAALLVVAISDLLAGSARPFAGAASLPVGNMGRPPGGAT